MLPVRYSLEVVHSSVNQRLHGPNSYFLFAGITGAIACTLFGVYGDARFWMPHWEHNNMGYSFWFACIGTVSSIIAGVCFLVESRKHNIKRNFLYGRE